MANNTEISNKGSLISERKGKIPVAGLNPGALVFHQGRLSHVEPHQDEGRIKDHLVQVQEAARRISEAEVLRRSVMMPYNSAHEGSLASGPETFLTYNTDLRAWFDHTNNTLITPPGSGGLCPAPYFPDGNGGFGYNYDYNNATDYVDPADPFAGQLYEIDEVRHGGPVRGYAGYHGHGYGGPDGHDGADERNGNSKSKVKNKKKKMAKKAKKVKGAFKAEHENSQESGKKFGGGGN